MEQLHPPQGTICHKLSIDDRRTVFIVLMTALMIVMYTLVGLLLVIFFFFRSPPARTQSSALAPSAASVGWSSTCQMLAFRPPRPIHGTDANRGGPVRLDSLTALISYSLVPITPPI